MAHRLLPLVVAATDHLRKTDPITMVQLYGWPVKVLFPLIIHLLVSQMSNLKYGHMVIAIRKALLWMRMDNFGRVKTVQRMGMK